MLWVYILLVLAPVLALLAKPLFSPRRPRLDQTGLNAAVYKQQVKELEQDIELGIIDGSQYETARKDIENSLATGIYQERQPVVLGNSRRKQLSLTMFTVIVLLSITIYWFTGTPDYNKLATVSKPPLTMEEAIRKLTEKLKTEPANLEGWLMLARSYSFTGKDLKAVEAYRKAQKLSNDDPDIMSQLAFTLIKTTKSFAGEPIQLLRRTLEKDPGNQEALFLVGRYHFDSGRYKQALEYWEKLIKLTSPQDSKPVMEMINEAKSRLGVTPESREAVSEPYLLVNVGISPELKKSINNPAATVFVYAQAAKGPKMPLAAQKITVGDLPVKIKLYDSMALNPELKLSSFSEIIVIARISTGGDAMPSPDDYTASKTTKELNREIRLMIE